MSTSARGSGPSPLRRGAAPVFGASPLGHAISVYRDNPVDVLKAKNSLPAGASESKSMISRWKSSAVSALAAGANANVVAGGGVEIGSKPRFLSTHLRLTCMTRLVSHISTISAAPDYATHSRTPLTRSFSTMHEPLGGFDPAANKPLQSSADNSCPAQASSALCEAQ